VNSHAQTKAIPEFSDPVPAGGPRGDPPALSDLSGSALSALLRSRRRCSNTFTESSRASAWRRSTRMSTPSSITSCCATSAPTTAAAVSNQRLLRTIILCAGYAAGSSICPSTPSWLLPLDPTCRQAQLSNITWLNSSGFVGPASNGASPSRKNQPPVPKAQSSPGAMGGGGTSKPGGGANRVDRRV
jgi:hypothetical protein